jgi:hypothetical protein
LNVFVTVEGDTQPAVRHDVDCIRFSCSTFLPVALPHAPTVFIAVADSGDPATTAG